MTIPFSRKALSPFLSGLFFLFAFLLPLFGENQAAPATRDTVRILTVGNSFSGNSTKYLPDLAKAGGKKLILLNCIKGGCTLETHTKAIQAGEKDASDPASKIYAGGGSSGLSSPLPQKFNLAEVLPLEKWDYITIQQASMDSYKPETYEPHAKVVVDMLRKNCPTAQILVHETWAYREDDPLFKTGDFTTAKMHEKLKAAYAKLAADYKLSIIPVGDAFQAARATPRWHFVPDTKFDFTNPKEGTLPDQTGSLNGGWAWKADTKKPQATLGLDSHHANSHGQYLGAAVFYEVLFGDNVEKVSFCPTGMTPEDAASLRKIAHETVQAQAK